MIIHYNDPKFIFIHTARTAGGSIERFLYKKFDKPPYGYGQGIARRTRHGSISMAREKLLNRGADPDTFLSFAFVRDPWDRALSYYFHHKKKVAKEKNISKEDFRQWVVGELFSEKHPYFPLPFLVDGEVGVDKLFRYETLYEDLDFLCTRYLQTDITKFPLKHAGTRPENTHYSDWYDEDTASIVADHAKFELGIGYEFDNNR